MTGIEQGTARVAVDPTGGFLDASVDLAASPERVFRAISSEIPQWWTRPGVFDAREWACELRPRGPWRAAGVSRGQPYVAGGEIVEVDPPCVLVHTWDGIGAPGSASTLTYRLEASGDGTRLTFRQDNFASPMACREFAVGWQTSFDRLAELLALEAAAARA